MLINPNQHSGIIFSLWVDFQLFSNKHLLSTYYVPGTVLDPRDTVVNKTKISFLIIFMKLMF